MSVTETIVTAAISLGILAAVIKVLGFMPGPFRPARQPRRVGVIHHGTRVEVASGVWQVARPLRDPSPIGQRRGEWRCRGEGGHCWHPDLAALARAGVALSWCCMCSKDGIAGRRECGLCGGYPA